MPNYGKQQNEYHFFVDTPPPLAKTYTCRRCSEEFTSNNKLHAHVRRCKATPASKPERSPVAQAASGNEPIIVKSTVAAGSHFDHNFRSWRYAIIQTSIENSKTLTEVCADSDCEESINNRSFLAEEIPNYQRLVKQRTKPIRVRNINNAVLDSKKYLSIEFKMPDELNDKLTIATFTKNVNIINRLKTKLLLSNNILEPKNIVLDISKNVAIINSCQNLTTSLTVTNRGSPIKRLAKTADDLRVLANSIATILYKLRDKTDLSTNKNFMFIPQRLKSLKSESGILSHIVDAYTEVIQVRNSNSEAVYILKNSKIDVIQEYEKEECYLANQKDAHLTANSESHKPAKQNWFKQFLKTDVAAAAAEAAAFAAYQSVATQTTDVATATKLVTPTGITVYGESPAIQQQLTAVAEAYPKLWFDDSFTIRISPKEHMPIDIQSNAKIKTAKIYSLEPTDRKFVNKTFDKLHKQKRIKYFSQPTSHNYPIFVMWRTVPDPENPERKKRVIINIKKLNKIAITDFYPMLLQSDITSSVADCRYIFVFDVADFFH